MIILKIILLSLAIVGLIIKLIPMPAASVSRALKGGGHAPGAETRGVSAYLSGDREVPTQVEILV